MATLINKNKKAAANQSSQEQHPENNLSWDAKILRVNEDQFTRVSRKIKLRDVSHEFSRTVSQILGSLSKLDELVLKSPDRVQSGTAPGTSRRYDKEKLE